MAATVTTAGHPAAATQPRALTALATWAKGHRQLVTYAAALVVIGAVLFVWNLLSAKTAEQNAGRQLDQGRLALASKNYPLAASVLSRVVEDYSGTRAAQEGEILLAQVRLAQGQSDQAVTVLKRFAPGAGRDYQAQAYGLLGAALENTARLRDAAEAYQQAADAAQFPFLRAQFLSDAGRAWVEAHDTARAVAAYRIIAEKLDSTSSATEAQVRLGELLRGTDVRAESQ